MINKSHFIGEHIDDIGKSYEFIKELGKGSYGQVFRCQNKITGNVYACKKMNKKKIKNKEQFKTEINLLRATDHPNIIKLYDIYEDNKYMYLIMEECNGGEFFDSLAKRAKEKKMYTEKECARIFKQILEAVNYLHAHGVCHRDLKPENILFSNVADDSCLKLIDFGLSKVMDGDNTLKGTVGTTFYMAPEVITGNYNEKCDIWACGVILYIMLCGKPPFYSQDEEELKKKICSMKYDFNYPEFKKVSQDAIELIQKILVPPEKRLSASEILSTPWLKENAPNAVVMPNAISINPLNWRLDDTYAPAGENLGSLVLNEKTGETEIRDIGADAQVVPERGVVVTNANHEPMTGMPDVFGTQSFHNGDYTFYYNNIKDNVAKRIAAYQNK